MNEHPVYNPMNEDTKSRRVPIWLVLGISVMCCGLLVIGGFFFFRTDARSLLNQVFPSSTVTASVTPLPTPTPDQGATQQAFNVTSTAQAIQTTAADAIGSWPVVHTNNFETDANPWYTTTVESNSRTETRKTSDGVYVWDITSRDDFFAWFTPQLCTAGDFYLTVEIRLASYTPSSDFGLVFRKDESDNFYYFGLSSDGFYEQFHVLRRFNNEWSDIIEKSHASGVTQSGEKNKLTVIGQGSYFVFLINDRIVGEAIDDRIASGDCGIAVQMYEAGLQGTYEFDNFELRSP
jgi:hypothetical protein